MLSSAQKIAAAILLILIRLYFRYTGFWRLFEWMLFVFLGIELGEFIPSLESLFEAEELRNAGLSENAQFRFLLRSGYEQIARASILSS